MTNFKSIVLHEFDGKLKPCPFCKSEFELIHESFVNCNGKEVNHFYWRHRDNKDCLIEDIICESLHIGAGDVNLVTGYLGEYAEKWNKALEC